MTSQLPTSPIAGVSTLELTLEHAPLLQKFFEDNEAYFLATSGEPAGPGEAIEEIVSELPLGWAHTKKLVIGYIDDRGGLVAMANVITDLLASSVFHIGTFIVATIRHGSGDAQTLYRGLESWSFENGAAWMRLGVVSGNVRAERFWSSMGYMPVRRREGVEMGRRTVSVQTMFKPLRGGTLECYLSLVPRDRSADASTKMAQGHESLSGILCARHLA
jgi:ribosomal protein S18 acetylase RimI-like enzyme